MCFDNSIETWRACFLFRISLRQYGNVKKKFDMFTLIIKIQIIFAQQLVLVSVFLSGYKNMVLNQSAWVFALGYFQNFD